MRHREKEACLARHSKGEACLARHREKEACLASYCTIERIKRQDNQIL